MCYCLQSMHDVSTVRSLDLVFVRYSFIIECDERTHTHMCSSYACRVGLPTAHARAFGVEQYSCDREKIKLPMRYSISCYDELYIIRKHLCIETYVFVAGLVHIAVDLENEIIHKHCMLVRLRIVSSYK